MAKKINMKKGIMKTSFMLSLVLIFSLTVGLIADVANAGKDVEFIQITVKPGDNLWKIADHYDNNKMDLRKLIYQIEKINEINADIYPGQVLDIPIYK
ncbi:MAG: cell division suppressor protein YneA [Peptococcaceae bacterium]